MNLAQRRSLQLSPLSLKVGLWSALALCFALVASHYAKDATPLYRSATIEENEILVSTLDRLASRFPQKSVSQWRDKLTGKKLQILVDSGSEAADLHLDENVLVVDTGFFEADPLSQENHLAMLLVQADEIPGSPVKAGLDY